jgi:hypothetical protein
VGGVIRCRISHYAIRLPFGLKAAFVASAQETYRASSIFLAISAGPSTPALENVTGKENLLVRLRSG